MCSVRARLLWLFLRYHVMGISDCGSFIHADFGDKSDVFDDLKGHFDVRTKKTSPSDPRMLMIVYELQKAREAHYLQVIQKYFQCFYDNNVEENIIKPKTLPEAIAELTKKTKKIGEKHFLESIVEETDETINQRKNQQQRCNTGHEMNVKTGTKNTIQHAMSVDFSGNISLGKLAMHENRHKSKKTIGNELENDEQQTAFWRTRENERLRKEIRLKDEQLQKMRERLREVEEEKEEAILKHAHSYREQQEIIEKLQIEANKTSVLLSLEQLARHRRHEDARKRDAYVCAQLEEIVNEIESIQPDERLAELQHFLATSLSSTSGLNDNSAKDNTNTRRGSLVVAAGKYRNSRNVNNTQQLNWRNQYDIISDENNSGYQSQQRQLTSSNGNQIHLRVDVSGSRRPSVNSSPGSGRAMVGLVGLQDNELVLREKFALAEIMQHLHRAAGNWLGELRKLVEPNRYLIRMLRRIIKFSEQYNGLFDKLKNLQESIAVYTAMINGNETNRCVRTPNTFAASSKHSFLLQDKISIDVQQQQQSTQQMSHFNNQKQPRKGSDASGAIRTHRRNLSSGTYTTTVEQPDATANLHRLCAEGMISSNNNEKHCDKSQTSDERTAMRLSLSKSVTENNNIDIDQTHGVKFAEQGQFPISSAAFKLAISLHKLRSLANANNLQLVVDDEYAPISAAR